MTLGVVLYVTSVWRYEYGSYSFLYFVPLETLKKIMYTKGIYGRKMF